MILQNKFAIGLLALFVLVSCKKAETHTPTISLRTGNTYIYDGAVVAFNGAMLVGVDADGGGANISMIRITTESETGTHVLLDSGMNTNAIGWSRLFYKGNDFTEEWTITIMNKDRQQASVSLHIYKDSASTYGDILSYPSVILGTQNNTSVRNFFNPASGNYYFPSEVTTPLEVLIDIATYYDSSDGYTFFSPGCSASSDYYPAFLTWTTLPYTAWDVHTAVSTQAFDNAQNDSLLVVAYDEVYGKKKYKFSAPGTVIPFKTANGKKGMVKVIATNGNDIGTIEFALKIQK